MMPLTAVAVMKSPPRAGRWVPERDESSWDAGAAQWRGAWAERRRAVSAAGRPGYHGIREQGPYAAEGDGAAGGESSEGSAMLKGFKEFILRGNVIDLAVAVVIGAAFGAVVKAFVDNLITPLIAAIFGKPDFSGLAFTINGSIFKYGLFINALITFVLVAAAVYFVVVAPMNKLAERRARGADPETKQCPECLSEIPHGARKCAFCGSEQHEAAPA
jgi:large conductance mechanosensitive channel